MPEAKSAARADAATTLDLHGKTQYQARVALDAALRRSRGLYRIHVVHGYHSGTALRDMIWREYAAHPLVLRLEEASEGATDLVLREL
ncbi:MAG: Smr/MutS family protein [Clostridiales bacterium]|nr:Smr/MutS family protein [Clostridiales bacterium]